MLSEKNLSPAQIALLSAGILAVAAGLSAGLLSGRWLEAFILFLFLLAVGYSLIHRLVQQFIYRKIKLIYKFISQTKATPREEFYASELLPPKTIDEVNADVQRWAEERKFELERLQGNEQFRKEFLMNLAHELRTPIFSSQGYIHTLLDGALNDPKVNQDFLSKAAKSIDRLADLVDDLNVISKLESNRLPLFRSDFVIQEMIREVFGELEQKAAAKGIVLRIKKGCESPIEVNADQPKIRQVLVNLVENSIKYGRQKGETTAGIYVVDSRSVFIEITDNGMGMAEEHIPRVFERFYRTDSARSRDAGGTGLGLAIVKHIIEAHGHSVTCRSKQDVGSSFGFTLDRSKA
jgi:two-component system phosphate regulon sensor histidine kinase PhoR